MTTTSVKTDKYTIQHEDGTNVRVLRNDLPWLDSDMLVGHKMLIAVADEIETLRTVVNVAQSLPASNEVAWTIDCDSFPLHYSMSLDTAAGELKKLYEAWPSGLDEIESALSLNHDGKHAEANEASKCASAIKYAKIATKQE